MTEATKVSIVIPAYNEEMGINTVLKQLADVMNNSDVKHEVIVVDDGSVDRTATRAEEAGVQVVHHPTNRGYGASIKTGIRRARYSVICITDADGTYPLEQVPTLVEHLLSRELDMVVGARTGPKVAIPLLRRPAKWAIGRLAQLVAGEKILDLNSGLRVFRRQAALRLFRLLPDGFSFTTTITLAMLNNSYLVEYKPINYHPRVGRSKIRPLRDTLNFIGLVLRIALYFAPLKIFIPLSSLLLILAIAWGFFSKLVLGELADVSTVVILLAAVQVGILGLLAELMDRRLPNVYREEE